MKLDQYRDLWLSEGFDEYIGFYPREFFCFDNFSSFKVENEGLVFSTVEHAYQYYKFDKNHPEIANKIFNSFSSHEAQKIAYANKDKVHPNFNENKVKIMEKLLRLKLEQNPYVLQKLLQTKNYQICEDSPKDAFWGIGENKDGVNQLGKLWMKIREDYIN